jgi:hypothetical protein
MNVKKTKVMVFNSTNPCQEFVFEGDVIKCMKTFKYLEILLETIPNLDSVVEHLAAANRCSLFALNCRYVELRIMDVELCYDLFNTLVHSTTGYAYEVWMDSKKIEAIEVGTKGFLSPCSGCEKQPAHPSCWQNLANYPLNTLHGDKHCWTIIV